MKPKAHIGTLLVLAGLCVLAYLPVFFQPLLEDDWPWIVLARDWRGMLAHPVYRYRAVFWLATRTTDALFGVSAPAFYALSVALHIASTWLMYAMGALPKIGWRVSALAAAFFAVYEGHQEAVMWYSASAETWMFLFGVGAVLAWGRRRYWIAFLLFVLALVSKESAVIFAPLMLLVERRWKHWIPFAALTAAYGALILTARTYSFRFQDGSFELRAPFWITLPVSYGRMLWFWGVAALIVLAALRKWPAAVKLGLTWMAVALLPYVFLTYMHRVPSRHTYVASLGLALIVGAAAALLPRRAVAIAAIAAVTINVGYLWTRKRAQFLDRAAPTEALIAAARKSPGPVYVRCFPLAGITAEAAAKLGAGKTLVWKPEPGATDFCFDRNSR